MKSFLLPVATALALSACDEIVREYNVVDGSTFLVCATREDSITALEIAAKREFWSATQSLNALQSRGACQETGFSGDRISSGVMTYVEENNGIEVRIVGFTRDPSAWPRIAPGAETLYTCLISTLGSGAGANWRGCEEVIMTQRTQRGLADFLNKL